MQAGEKSVAERGEEKMVQIVKDLDAAELSLRSVTDIRTTRRGCKTSVIILWLHSTPIIESSVLPEVLI